MYGSFLHLFLPLSFDHIQDNPSLLIHGDDQGVQQVVFVRRTVHQLIHTDFVRGIAGPRFLVDAQLAPQDDVNHGNLIRQLFYRY